MKEMQGENLFGRENILGLLGRRVADLKDGYRQNIALLGNVFVGKSAILQEFIKSLDDNKVLPIYIEIENIDFEDFVNKYIGTMILNFLEIQTKTEEEKLEVLLETAKRFIPSTVEQAKKVKSQLSKNKFLEAYKELISLPEILFQETGIFCLVIFDEFQNLEEFGFPFVFQELGKKIMLQRNCLYIVSSSQKARAKKILSEKLSLLFGNFDLVDIFAFDVKASQNFINQKFSDVAMNNDYRNFLVDLTGGYPFYLDVICGKLSEVTRARCENIVFLDSLIETLTKLLFDKTGFFYQHFNNLLEKIEMGSFKRHLTSLLLKLADGQNKLNDLSSNSTKVTKGIALRLSRLLELNIISKNGNFYYICDRLFSFWLRSVYQKDTNTFNYDRRSQAACFKDLLKVSIDSFSRVSQKNLANRVLELFYSFDNEYFQFNGHKYRLPIFKEIKSLKYAQQNPASFDSIIARGSQISWLVLLKEEEVFEDDINNFLEETKRFNLKPEKKILIFANGIEPNARLKALQEKMWLWNLSDLNLLMNFYHKPYFIK